MHAYKIYDALSVMNNLGATDKHQLEQFYGDAITLELWLDAERKYTHEVQAWLDAEQRWHKLQFNLKNDPLLRAAKAGWLEMKKVAPALDGVVLFEDMSGALQYRYARFAYGVLYQDLTSDGEK